MIVGVFEHLGSEGPLGVAELTGEFAPKVSQPIWEGL